MSTRDVAVLASAVPVVPLEIPHLGLQPCPLTTTYPIATCVINPQTTRAVEITRLPPVLHSNRPFEIEFAGIDYGVDAGDAMNIVRSISAHANLLIEVDKPGLPRASFIAPLSVRPSDGGDWIARALIRPASWADAAFVTVIAIAFAGQQQLCKCLPATLLVGYNHASAPAGAVLQAAEAGDVPALQAALNAGSSTEEADRVRGGRWEVACLQGRYIASLLMSSATAMPQYRRSALWWAAANCHVEALSTLLAAGANASSSTTVRGCQAEQIRPLSHR